MSLSTEYLKTLKELAKAKYEADVGVIEGDFRRKAGGKITGTGAQALYKSPEQIKAEGGEPEYGELDIAYERKRQGLESGLESRGILRSGQAATARGRMASDYQQSILDYYNAMTSKKGALGAQYAFNVADLEAKYGNQTQRVAAPDSPKVTDETKTKDSLPSSPYPSSSDKPASEMTPEESFAFIGLGQPANKQAATGVSAQPLPQPPLDAAKAAASAAYMALGQAPNKGAAAPPKPPTAPAPQKPMPPKPAASAKPAAPAPVKKPAKVKLR